MSKCIQCKKEMQVFPSRIKKGHGKFCSLICRNINYKKRVGIKSPLWNRIGIKCKICKKIFLVKLSHIHIRKHCSIKCYKITLKQQMTGNIYTKGRVPPNKGKKMPTISMKMKGEGNHQWKGGIYITHKKIRTSPKYQEWVVKIKERDNYKCVVCGSNHRINADHIKPFALYPEIRFNLNNGQTLCVDCHKIKTKKEWEIYKFNDYRDKNVV